MSVMNVMSDVYFWAKYLIYIIYIHIYCFFLSFYFFHYTHYTHYTIKEKIKKIIINEMVGQV